MLSEAVVGMVSIGMLTKQKFNVIKLHHGNMLRGKQLRNADSGHIALKAGGKAAVRASVAMSVVMRWRSTPSPSADRAIHSVRHLTRRLYGFEVIHALAKPTGSDAQTDKKATRTNRPCLWACRLRPA